MSIDGQTVKRLAIDGYDLKPLWDRMGGTLWKKTWLEQKEKNMSLPPREQLRCR